MLLSVVAACGGNSTAADKGGGGGGSSGGKSSGGTYLMYMSVDTSGPTAVLGKALKAGAEVAVHDVNAKGGIDGRKLELKVVDDTNDPTKAVNLLQKQLSSGKTPDLVYPGGATSVELSMLPVLTRNKILSIGAASGSQLNDPKKYPYAFGVTPPSASYIPALIKTAKKKNFHKIAMIFSDDGTGHSSEQQYKSAVEKAGMTFVSASYPADALDMTSQLQSLRSKHPDALVIHGYGAPALYVLRGRAQIGWNVPSYGDQDASATPIAGKLKASQIKNYKVEVIGKALANAKHSPELPKVIKQFKATPQGKLLPAVGYPLFITTYDLLRYVHYVADKNHTTDTQKLVNAFEHFKTPNPAPWPGAIALYEYTPTNHFPLVPNKGYEFVKPGEYNADGFYVPGKGF
jgi:branched-chain amino acid transport system substrate-binding protein